MMRGIRFFAVSIAAAAFIAFGVNPAMAQMWEITADVPANFTFVDDSPNNNSISADSVGGFRLGVITPWLVGVGITRVAAVVSKGTLDGKDQTYNFNFTDLLVGFNISSVSVTLGYGTGNLTIDPASSTFSGQELKFGDADATQTIIGLGWMFSDNWDVHLGYHAMVAKDVTVDYSFLGIPIFSGKGDIGATMLTAGVGYYF